MDKRKFAFFEWIVVDNCNLQCTYCVNKGKQSQKPLSSMLYKPGIEINIAEKIASMSGYFNEVTVNLTGGEPTLAKNLLDALAILAKKSNITVQMISNLKETEKLAAILPYVQSVIVSLHAAYRTDQEIDSIIRFINTSKKKTSFTLTQVDYQLQPDDHAKLARISKHTGMKIQYQTYIPPRSSDVDTNKAAVPDAKLRTTFGKRCSLGYFYFMLHPDGTINYDLWCNARSRKSGDFLSDQFDNPEQFVLPDMRQCPHESCGCNYNLFDYKRYRKECGKNGYPVNEIFPRYDASFFQLVMRRLTRLKAAAVQKIVHSGKG